MVEIDKFIDSERVKSLQNQLSSSQLCSIQLCGAKLIFDELLCPNHIRASVPLPFVFENGVVLVSLLLLPDFGEKLNEGLATFGLSLSELALTDFRQVFLHFFDYIIGRYRCLNQVKSILKYLRLKLRSQDPMRFLSMSIAFMNSSSVNFSLVN